MEILYLVLVFAAIIILLAVKRPLYQAILGGLVVIVMLFRIPLSDVFGCTANVLTRWSSLSVLVSMYMITLLQRILEARKQIKLAQQDLNGISGNRRVNTASAALFIGLLPSAASMILSSDVIKEATDGCLDKTEQALAASWLRHIPESTLPTYAGVLLMLTISGVEPAKFMAGMIVPVITLLALGWFTFLRRIPKETGTPKSEAPLKDAAHLLGHLWSLLLILVLIIGFGFDVVTSVVISIAISLVVYRVKPQELKTMLVSAFEKKMLLNTFLVLVLNEFIKYTGVLELLPEAMSVLPLPAYIILAFLFFVSTIISGVSGAIAMGTPIAFATLPVGMPLMVYLMCVAHAASQLSPTHICLVIAAEYFDVPLGRLIKKTVPLAIVFCILMTVYYNILVMLG